MVRSILNSWDQVMLAVLELCEDRNGELLLLPVDDIVSNFADSDAGNTFPDAYLVRPQIYYSFLHLVDFLYNVAESKGIEFDSKDLSEYIIRYFASKYVLEGSVLEKFKGRYFDMKSEVCCRVLENVDFDFAVGSLGIGDSGLEDKWYKHQMFVDRFKKRYLISEEV